MAKFFPANGDQLQQQRRADSAKLRRLVDSTAPFTHHFCKPLHHSNIDS
jgi:hypothetical protein